ncbi:hypothetical protein BD289DRAFT_481742 [Coniella lustricola]|uniref:NTF2 domain-containing protein n=1 Tax=Coniella lustricola TaxID=2025994 RepID=A0A2T3ABA4_9PEZI|nr:hypothetical protein BD289DRAFT_481742 [Coniella lustricola]
MATNGNFNHQEQYPAAPGSDAPSAAAAESTHGAPLPSKDEVGWYFVEQYYTTLSKNPSKLHLFYNKRSQFVQGPEAELVDVSVGRQAIQERIKELDFQDCKVRVSNVDSQASFENIVIQVIGEISNKSAEPKKFVQTFVLAQQPAGYFLLNDILRYVSEGDEEASEGAAEEPAAPAAVEAEPAQKAEPEPEATPAPAQVEESVEEPATTFDAQAVDQKLEEASTPAKEAPSTTAEESPVEAAPVTEETTSKPEATEATPSPEKVEQEVAAQETSQPEVPKDPSPTPAPAQAPAPEPEKPKGPPKPMTWASLAAAGSGKTAVKPAIPLPNKGAAAAAPAQTRAPAATASPAAAPATTQSNAPAPAADASAQAGNKDANEWRTAGADSKKQNRQHSGAAPTAEKEGTLAYVKFVTDKVKDEDLKSALSAFGELVYFDINRVKTCAFVEYATVANCQAAIKASPLTIEGESIAIETRRPKASAYGGANYSNNRGGMPGRGRGGFDGNRSGGQGGGRGGYTNRGRGAPRGRGGAQPTNA